MDSKRAAKVLGLIFLIIGGLGLSFTTGTAENAQAFAAASFNAFPKSTLTADQKISPLLKEVLAKVSPENRVNIVVELTAPEATALAVYQQQRALQTLQTYGFVVAGYYLNVMNGLVGSIPAKNVYTIASDPNVKAVYYADAEIAKIQETQKIILLSDSVPMIKVPDVWKQGYTGQGVTVIEIDSGIQNNHPALMRNGKSLVLEEKVIVPGASDYTHWHGTHVAGIIASQDSKYKGVAPGIKGFVDILAFDWRGSATFSWVMSALDYAYQVADEYKPAVCTNSWGGYGVQSPEVDKVRYAALKLASKVPTVFAAGNLGMYGSGTIAFPGDADGEVNGKYYDIITVGAVDKAGRIAWFSSRGPDKWGKDHNEPDIVAPGVSIMSTVPGGFKRAQGTSMATPHVSGVIALMLSKNPNLDHTQVFDIITKTAKDLGPGGFDYSYGYGLIMADKAIAATPSAGISVPIPAEMIINVGLAVMTLLGLYTLINPDPMARLIARVSA